MFDIDIVYLWCDGNDPEFKKRKNNYLKKEGKINSEASGEERFYDNDELKYSLRSLEKYANWIRHIFIVTDRQVPSWLNLANKRVSIVDHSEILPNRLIPCFNSTILERYLFNIPGLAEHFIYGNDDMFFGQNVSTEFFFTKEGKPIVRFFPFSELNTNLTRQNGEDLFKKASFWGKSIINSGEIFLRQWKLNNLPLYELHHNFDAYLKSEYKKIYYKYESCFNSSLNRFRSEEDINRILFGMELVKTKNAELKVLKKINRFLKIGSVVTGKKIDSYYIEKKMKSLLLFSLIRCKLFCLNDASNTTSLDNQFEKIFLRHLFSKKSSFEI